MNALFYTMMNRTRNCWFHVNIVRFFLCLSYWQAACKMLNVHVLGVLISQCNANRWAHNLFQYMYIYLSHWGCVLRTCEILCRSETWLVTWKAAHKKKIGKKKENISLYVKNECTLPILGMNVKAHPLNIFFSPAPLFTHTHTQKTFYPLARRS